MNLNALVLCADDKVMRVLRRVLSDLEVGIETCSDADSAVRKLTRSRFEAVVVDCVDEDRAAKVLSSVRSAPCNKRAIAVAMIDGQKAVRSAFALGAHFVLYKPVTFERARSSFRAARALMKCERRRNVRVPIEMTVALIAGANQQQITTLDISEGGMAMRVPRQIPNGRPVNIKFTLPGTDCIVNCPAEVAWKNPGSHSGVRFLELSREQRLQLKMWLAKHSSEIEPDDPPVGCKPSDVSPAACYLETPAPFPVRTRLALMIQSGVERISAEGVVRVMHPESGMGVEFVRRSADQRSQSEKLVRVMTASKSPLELSVAPEGMDDEEEQPSSGEDPLLQLFARSTELAKESFQEELRAQRRAVASAVSTAV